MKCYVFSISRISWSSVFNLNFIFTFIQGQIRLFKKIIKTSDIKKKKDMWLFLSSLNVSSGFSLPEKQVSRFLALYIRTSNIWALPASHPVHHFLHPASPSSASIILRCFLCPWHFVLLNMRLCYCGFVLGPITSLHDSVLICFASLPGSPLAGFILSSSLCF